MKQYQIDSLVNQIVSHTDRLALPLSDRDCVINACSRNALYLDIVANIDHLYDHSLIDSLQKVELLISLSQAFIDGGV